MRRRPQGEPPALSDYPGEPREGVPSGGCRGAPGAPIGATPRISIVTAVRNGARTLGRAIASVASQAVPGVEHIVVDGASSDGTLDVLRSHGPGLALWISEPDRGISDAFNKGIALARGDVVGILNSDDWYEPGALAAVAQAMRDCDAEIVCGSLQYWEGDRRTYLARSDPAFLARAMHVQHPTVFVRRETYRRLGLFRLDFRLAMDYEWMLRARTAGASFLALDRCIANMSAGGVGDRRWRALCTSRPPIRRWRTTCTSRARSARALSGAASTPSAWASSGARTRGSSRR